MCRHAPATEGDRARVVGVDPEDRPGDLAATRPDQAGQADAVVRPWTSSTTSPTVAGVFGNSSETSRPTIRATISETEVSSIRSVET